MIAPDSRERERALDVTRSFIVQAPAGSGKTELLVQRYLKLLATVDKPEEIVAITFSKKAAAEMRKRVLENLPHDLAPRLRIQTIDALCAALTRQIPVLARFDAHPAIAEDPAKLYEEAAARTLARLTPSVSRLLAHLDNNVMDATRLLAVMLERRDQWLRKTGQAPPREELESTLAAEAARLLHNAQLLYPHASVQLAQEVLTKAGEWCRRPPAPAHLVAIPGLREALCALRTAPMPRYSDAQWEALDAILALLEPALTQLLALFSERGEVDFTQIAHAALHALGTPDEPTDLLLSMDVRVRHLLVDEFQDTSNSQWELLERLTAGWEPGDGRTLFVVGDPMQSIYRFRDAQVGLFLQARRAGLGGVELEPLTLSTNFRSQAAIVEWVNASFPHILPGAEDESAGAVAYSPSLPFKATLPGAAPLIETFADRQAEVRRVLELLRGAKGKKAILVRNRSHLDAIVPALKDAGIRFRAVEIEQLGEKQVVQDLYALTRALTHFADRIAWLAVLRAPWCGLTLQELCALSEGKTDSTIWELMQDMPRLARLREVLTPALANRMRGTLRDRVEGAWLALGGPACVHDATDLEDADIFFDELERLEVAGELADFSVLARRLQTLYAIPDVNAGPDAVEIMTIHKAKGLEFGTVIVPGLDRPPGSGRKPLFAWRSLVGGRLLLAPIDATGGESEPLYDYVRELDKAAEDIEAARLLYVAVTRAESHLHLLACVKCGPDGELKAPSKRSLLGIAWPAWAREAKKPAGPPAQSSAESNAIDAPLRRLPADFVLPQAPAALQWRPTDPVMENQVEFSWAGETARHMGTVVHAWLRRMAEDCLEGWDDARVERLRAAVRAQLRSRGVGSAEIEAVTLRVLQALRNAMSDEKGRWILGPHAEAKCEYRIRTRSRSLVIDRLIRDTRGNRWAIDYKTSAHEGADIEGFLDREQTRYAAQLDAYAAALGGASRALYFPLLVGWREW